MNSKKIRKKVNRTQRKINLGRMINKDILKVSVFFCILFLSLVVYLGYFLLFRAEPIINSPYNSRSDQYKKTVTRGAIYDTNYNALAYTQTDENGNETRIYPYGNIFAHVVGYSDLGGLGLEASYNNSLLTSHAGFIDKTSNEMAGTKNPGDSIRTTLDARMQEYISGLMDGVSGSCILIEPGTGGIPALVSKPDFDPNNIAANWEWITYDTEGSPLLNRATQGKYTPGSTFKVFTLMEYIRENPAFWDYSFNCAGSFTYDGSTISCFDHYVHGYEDLRSSLANSCNCSFANISLMLNNDLFAKNNEALLFNSKIDIDIASNPAKFSLSSASPSDVTMQTGFGQGSTYTNPLHLALIMSAFANNGVLMKPHLLSEVVSESGRTITRFKEKEYKELFKIEECNIMNEYLRAVVTQGTANVLNYNTYTAYGKTGTAETATDSYHNVDRSWFAGYAEQNGSRIAICIVLDDLDNAPMSAVDYAAYVFDAYFNQ